MNEYNLAAIRGLLNDAFTAQDLWRFCQERPALQPVLIHFPFNATQAQMIDALTEYCRTQVLMVMPLFATSATREAIEASSDVHHFALDEALGQLVELSLMDFSSDLEQTRRRYGIHSLTRAFASKIVQDEVRALQLAGKRLAEYLCSVAAKCGRSHRVGYTAIEPELQNIVAAVQWCWEYREIDLGIELLRQARYLMIGNGYWNDLMVLSEQAIALGDELKVADLRVSPIGWIHRHRGELDAAREQVSEALETFERHGQTRGIARAKRHLGRTARECGDLNRAEALFRESLAFYQPSEQEYDYFWVMTDLASIALERGDLPAASERCRAIIDSVRSIGNPERLGHLLSIMARTTREQGDLQQAECHSLEALDLAKEINRIDAIADNLLGLAQTEASLGKFRSAQHHLLDALEIYKRLVMNRRIEAAEKLLSELGEGQGCE